MQLAIVIKQAGIKEGVHCLDPHQIALEADEVDPHGEGVVRVAAQGFDLLYQISTELVASLQHT